jgi:glutamate dehydrogenase
MGSACDIVSVADENNQKVADTGKAFFEVGHRLGIDWLRTQTEGLSTENHWDYLAANAIMDDLAEQQRMLTSRILKSSKLTPIKAVDRWMRKNVATTLRAERLMSDLKASGPVTVAKLSFAVRHMRSLLTNEDV